MLALAVVGLVVVAGCTGDDRGAGDDGRPGAGVGSPATTEADGRRTASSPFTVDDPPAGFVARSAGVGDKTPTWGDDSTGTEEPYLVLSPDGTPDHPDVVLVALTGYLGYQGGLDQASSGAPDDTEVTEVDGEEARYAPGDGTRWSDLVVAQGEADVAIRIASPDASEDELAALVASVVVPDDHIHPPAMPDPPDGLEVVGAVDANAVLADRTYVDQDDPGGPGPTTAHGVGWRRGQDATDVHLSVLALPAASADLDALAVGMRWQRERWGVDVAVSRDGDAVLVEDDGNGDPGTSHRAAWVTGPDGDVVVAAARGADPPSLDELLALARSATPTDEATWNAFVGEVKGGPGLRPDPDRTELMRGMVGDGRGWLLQDRPSGQEPLGPGAGAGAGAWLVEPCLVVTGGPRACPSAETNAAGLWSTSGRAEDGLGFTIVATTWPEVDALFVTADGDTRYVPLAPIAGTDQKAAAVVGDGFVFHPCGTMDLPPGTTRWIELSASSAGVPCPG